MKKPIFILAALLLIGNIAFSQTPSSAPTSAPSSTPSSSPSGYANGADKNFHFGLSVVPSLDWLSAGNSNNSGNGISLGFGFGVNLEFYFTQNYGFVTGVGLANIPGKYTNNISFAKKSGDSISTASTLHMQYVELPLLFKFRTLPIGLMRYFAMVGFNPGIRIKATGDASVTSVTGNTSVSGVDISSSTSIIRLPYLIGAGVEYNIAGTTSLQAYVSYDADFINISTVSGNSITSKSVTLTLGVLF